MLRTSLVLAAALAAAASLQGAGAGVGDFTRHVPVYFGDLNINTPAGRAALEARLEQAAAFGCGGNPTIKRDKPVYPNTPFDKCRAEAVKRALADIQATHGNLASTGKPTEAH